MKQVKFNLYVDEQKIRTIAELEHHFNIDDLLEWYEQGILQKWLYVRGYKQQLEKIEAIAANEKMEIAKEIITIFDFSEEQSKRALDSLNYRLNFGDLTQLTTEQNDDAVASYFTLYELIKNSLLERVE